MVPGEPEREQEHAPLPSGPGRKNPERLTAQTADEAEAVPLASESPYGHAGQAEDDELNQVLHFG